MSRWWRAYDEAVDDPKLQQLTGDEFKAWFNLCCLTSANGGCLPPIGHIAFKLRMRPDKAAKVIAALRKAGLLDEDETGIRPHNWNSRQYKSDVSTERVQRFRKRKRNVSSTVSETPPESETERKIPDEPDGSSGADSPASVVSTAPSTPATRPMDSRQRDGPTQAELERELFRRGKQVCGKSSGGLLASLLKSKQHDVALARAIIETAATKHDPREYVAAAIRSNGHGQSRRSPAENSATAAADRILESLGGMEAANRYVPGSAGPRIVDSLPGAADTKRLPKG